MFFSPNKTSRRAEAFFPSVTPIQGIVGAIDLCMAHSCGGRLTFADGTSIIVAYCSDGSPGARSATARLTFSDSTLIAIALDLRADEDGENLSAKCLAAAEHAQRNGCEAGAQMALFTARPAQQ